MTSLSITSCATSQPRMDTFIVKYNRACTVFPKQGSSCRNSWPKRLKKHGYSQSKTTPGLWKHKWRPIIFFLIVNNFGVKYVGKEHAQHLLQMVQKYYKCSLEEEGGQYCGLTIKWDYPRKKVHLSMLLYAKNGLKQFQHPPPNCAARSAAPTHPQDLWGKGATCKDKQ
jgi:hypothetical protein